METTHELEQEGIDMAKLTAEVSSDVDEEDCFSENNNFLCFINV